MLYYTWGRGEEGRNETDILNGTCIKYQIAGTIRNIECIIIIIEEHVLNWFLWFNAFEIKLRGYVTCHNIITRRSELQDCFSGRNGDDFRIVISYSSLRIMKPKFLFVIRLPGTVNNLSVRQPYHFVRHSRGPRYYINIFILYSIYIICADSLRFTLLWYIQSLNGTANTNYRFAIRPATVDLFNSHANVFAVAIVPILCDQFVIIWPISVAIWTTGNTSSTSIIMEKWRKK